MIAWIITQSAGSIISLIIILCMMTEHKLESMLQALYQKNLKSSFLWVMLFFTSFFLWFILIITNFIDNCRKSPNYFKNKLQAFKIIKNDPIIDLRTEIELRKLREEVNDLKTDMNNFSLQQYNKN